MNTPSQFDAVYDKSETQDDDLSSATEFLIKNPEILRDMLLEYLKSTINMYICLKGDIKSIDLITELGNLFPHSFGKLTRQVIEELSNDESNLDSPESRKDAIKWFTESHPEIYKDFIAEQAETESFLQSPRMEKVKSEGLDRILKEIRGRDEGGYSGCEGRNEPPGH